MNNNSISANKFNDSILDERCQIVLYIGESEIVSMATMPRSIVAHGFRPKVPGSVHLKVHVNSEVP